jgi:hypothetical protein
MTDRPDTPPPGDERLLDALRELTARVDPVPPDVVDAARSAIAWRRMDAELAELLYDSVEDQAALAGVRSEGGPRLLTFEAAEISVELEVTPSGDERRLVGQIVPPGEARLQVRHPAGVVEVTADALGRFATGALPAGPVSIRLEPAGAGHGPVETGWVAI